MKSSKNNSLVSVIIPTKNNLRTIEKCLASIDNQTYKNIELIVVDNYSSDGTPEIAKKHTLNVFTKGPERNTQRNFAVEKTKGKYLLFIDSDMYLDKSVISDCISLANEKSVAGIYIPEKSIGVGFWAECKQLERSFYVEVPWMNAARFFSRDNYLKVGGYDTKMISGEDWDLSQRLSSVGKIIPIKHFIFHDEGSISLISSMKKKFYYATKFSKYLKNKASDKNSTMQTSIIGRYWLFLKNPIKLFKNPILGLGVLFMKTCEFGAGGIGYLLKKND